MNTLSSTGEALIKEFETLELSAYLDQRGIPTIGWGHTGPDVALGQTCTAARAEAWFQEDTQSAVAGVDASLTTNVTQHQFDALVSFTYNVGVGAEGRSTLLRCVNRRDFPEAAKEFLRWDLVDGVPSAGLLRRRLAEQKLFISGNWSTMPP